MKTINLEKIEEAFGNGSVALTKASNLGNAVVWSTPRDENRDRRGVVRLSGTIKYVPAGVSYAFVTDESGQDWFMHRSSLRNPAAWANASAGIRVTFVGLRDRFGRGRTDDVVMDQLALGTS